MSNNPYFSDGKMTAAPVMGATTLEEAVATVTVLPDGLEVDMVGLVLVAARFMEGQERTSWDFMVTCVLTLVLKKSSFSKMNRRLLESTLTR